MKICIVCGARPNFIKVAPLVKSIERSREHGESIDYSLVYAGNLNDSTIEDSLFYSLGIRKPDIYLEAESNSLNVLANNVMLKFDEYLDSNPTDVVVVVDDLTSTMSAAITAKKKGIRLAHLVAGTRSFDINMPKEINRLVIDGLSDLLFTAGANSDSNINREGADLSKTYMVGNILIDTLCANHDKFHKPCIFDELSLKEKKYIVFTLNRKVLINDTDNLREIVSALSEASKSIPVVAPLRSDALRAVEKVLPADAVGIHFVAPMAYLEFGWLTEHAQGIVTDSGNVAEEATFNGVPCITLNDYTEHIETVMVGTNELVGGDNTKLQEYLGKMVSGEWKEGSLPERWDGRSADRIVHILLSFN